MNELIIKADLDAFQKNIQDQQLIVSKINNTKHIVQHFLPHLIAAIDLTNENIPLSVTNIDENLYKFSREIPQKLVFKSYEDVKAFAYCWKYDECNALYHFVDGVFTTLPDTEIVSFSISIESFSEVMYVMPYSQRCLLALTCIGIPFAIAEYMSELKLKNIVLNKGLTVTIKGYFKKILKATCQI